jgi:hypothetical protein
MAIRTVTACIVIIVLANLAAPAGAAAADLSQEIDQTITAIDARITAIGPSPADKTLKKGAKKLGKAIPYLDAWTGNNDLADFQTIYRAAKSIYKSKTPDPTIRVEIIDVIQCLFDLAATEQVVAEDVIPKLYVDKYKIKVSSVIDAAESVLGAGLSLLDTDYAAACKAAMKAFKGFGKALLKGEKYEDKASGDVPNGLTWAESTWILNIYNNSSKWYFVRDVLFTGEFRDGPSGTGQVLATMNGASLAALQPTLFVIDQFPGGGLDGQAMIGKMYSGDTMPVQHDLKTYLYAMREELLPASSQVYFHGSFILKIANRPDPGHKGEKIFVFPVAPVSNHQY